MSNNIKIILGPPGTGKTTKLMDIMEKEMENGVEPEEIAFVSFTRKAAQEAMERVKGRFSLDNTDFPFVRTLHSLAYKQLGIRRSEIMREENYKELGEYLGLEFSTKGAGGFEEGVPVQSSFNGDRYMFLDGFARARKLTPQQAWQQLGEYELNWFEYERFAKSLTEFKKDRALLDFSDLLSADHEAVPIKVAIIDEAQDLSTLQWEFVLKVFARAERIYIAGDDDQAIYTWSGADVSYFHRIPGEKTILHQSYRVPQKVHRFAKELTGRIHKRIPKEYSPTENRGSIDYHFNFDSVNMDNGSWLLLARNKYMLKQLAHMCRINGYLYSYRGDSIVNKEYLKVITLYERWRKGDNNLTEQEHFLVNSYMPTGTKVWPMTIWHEALSKIPLWEREFYISLLRRGEKLSGTPRINISTIHGVKGGEADNVMLLTDMTQKTEEAALLDPDAEHRVWYVAATRAKKNLHVIMPQTNTSYTI